MVKWWFSNKIKTIEETNHSSSSSKKKSPDKKTKSTLTLVTPAGVFKEEDPNSRKNRTSTKKRKSSAPDYKRQVNVFLKCFDTYTRQKTNNNLAVHLDIYRFVKVIDNMIIEFEEITEDDLCTVFSAKILDVGYSLTFIKELIKEIFSEYYDQEQMFVLESKKSKIELLRELVDLVKKCVVDLPEK